MGHVVSILTIQFCCYNAKAAKGSHASTNGHGYFPIKLYLNNRQWARFGFCQPLLQTTDICELVW